MASEAAGLGLAQEAEDLEEVDLDLVRGLGLLLDQAVVVSILLVALEAADLDQAAAEDLMGQALGPAQAVVDSEGQDLVPVQGPDPLLDQVVAVLVGADLGPVRAAVDLEGVVLDQHRDLDHLHQDQDPAVEVSEVALTPML